MEAQAHMINSNSIDLSSIFLLLLLALSAIIFLYSKHGKRNESTSRRPNLNLPPGSMGWPFIGETFAYLKHHPSFSLGTYLQTHIHRYGKIFKSNLFGEPTIVSADAGFNRFILQNEGRLFEASYPESVVRIMGEWSMLALTGEGHKEMRSIALNFLSSDILRNRLLSDIEQHALLVINTWKDGLYLSRGWKFLPVLSAVHLDGSIHKDPQEFNPWRWQNKLAISAVELMPYGGGNRLCAGAELAKLELAVFLHHLVLNYRWELANHDEPMAFPYVEFEKGLPIQVFNIS